uniref:Uncharacterized protein n=1 Tax=Oryza punctata TaxID=4537 RepID=A0A0E0LEP0_ORYPU
MDESWRCTMGSVLPRQRSSDHQAGGGGERQSLAPDDFRDVFGGPPRTVLLRSFYGGEAESYHSPAMAQQHHVYYGGGGADAFCRQGAAAAAVVPTEEGFFDDIFGAGRHVRSRSRSTKSSSVVSSDEFGAGPTFYRPAAGSGCRGGDATLSSFAPKLRPIAIPSRRYDSSPPSTASTRCDYQSSFTCSTAAYPASRCYYYAGRTATTNHSSAASSTAGGSESHSAAQHNHHRYHHRGGGGFCCFTSNPETTSNGHSFRRTRAGGRRARSPAADTYTATESWSHADYGYYYSPPSAASSSVFGNPLPRTPRRLEEVVMEVRERAPLLMDDGGGDIDSVGAAAVDEAIAWAKERFWSQA